MLTLLREEDAANEGVQLEEREGSDGSAEQMYELEYVLIYCMFICCPSPPQIKFHRFSPPLLQYALCSDNKSKWPTLTDPFGPTGKLLARPATRLVGAWVTNFSLRVKIDLWLKDYGSVRPFTERIYLLISTSINTLTCQPSTVNLSPGF